MVAKQPENPLLAHRDRKRVLRSFRSHPDDSGVAGSSGRINNLNANGANLANWANRSSFCEQAIATSPRSDLLELTLGTLLLRPERQFQRKSSSGLVAIGYLFARGAIRDIRRIRPIRVQECWSRPDDRARRTSKSRSSARYARIRMTVSQRPPTPPSARPKWRRTAPPSPATEHVRHVIDLG